MDISWKGQTKTCFAPSCLFTLLHQWLTRDSSPAQPQFLPEGQQVTSRAAPPLANIPGGGGGNWGICRWGTTFGGTGVRELTSRTFLIPSQFRFPRGQSVSLEPGDGPFKKR